MPGLIAKMLAGGRKPGCVERQGRAVAGMTAVKLMLRRKNPAPQAVVIGGLEALKRLTEQSD